MPYDSIDLVSRRNRIPYFSLKDKQKEKKKIREKLTKFHVYLSSMGLGFTDVNIGPTDGTNNFKLKMHRYRNIQKKSTKQICQDMKDKGLISDRVYKEIRESLESVVNLPSLATCSTYKKQVNNIWPIEQNDYGSYIKDPLKKITFVCKKYLEMIEDNEINVTAFDILLSGDSFNLTKTHINEFNFTFSLLNMKDISYHGFFVLGIFSIPKENYDSIKICLQELIRQLELIKEIEIENVKYNINFLLGGDLKWLSTVLGINSANANFPCPWCKWKNEPLKEEDVANNWKISRSRNESNKMIANQSTNDKKGYVKQPLFNFIEFDHCLVDILHLFLRITDKLYTLLLNRLEQLDIKYSGYKSGNLDDLKITNSFLKFLSECELTSPFYVKTKENGTSTYQLRKLNENERLKLFKKLYTRNCLLEIFKDFRKEIKEDPELITLNFVFSEFYIIYKQLKIQDEEDFNKNQLIIKLREWLKYLIKLTFKAEITPYIHILCFHIPEFIERYGSLRKFTMQGLEKFNHVTKMNYFRQTNYHRDFHIILLKKMNRLDFIHLNGDINENELE